MKLRVLDEESGGRVGPAGSHRIGTKIALLEDDG
jgi:hypothetical protein